MGMTTFEIPPARYYPFSSGIYSTSAGLNKLPTDFGNREADQNIFQIDTAWHNYHSNKEECRKEGIQKYYKTHTLRDDTRMSLSRYVIQQLLTAYPNIFQEKNIKGLRYLHCLLSGETITYDQSYQLTENSKYLSLLDALASFVQEDIAVWQWDGERDWMSLIHLCAPNHWAPADKIGKPFSEVHQPVAGMEKMRQRYQPMLSSLIKGGKYVRFAWGLSTDKRLNHHPDPQAGWDEDAWQGRRFDPENPSLFVRIERQTLSGLPEVNAVFFTIRTYFEEVNALEATHRKALLEALSSMSSASLKYKGLNDDIENIKAYLNT
ncbi:hypothetical protein OKW21_000966 [Catalinimonas alkaloidigena]|uniref:heme-dependent oxidative N-demethylase family protein n=1 Tax=Catalinimonas alkaloidigena TaxID=1075417 RepID=UPI0024066448|nr:DUF3445 domain-containing protein [Catalinimonas alkaloidigena]MDF9795703.1 hypothetical protein [Catalinimonas alkaloidigena]